MPELAEVDYFRKQWNPGIGRRIVRVTAHPETRLYRGCEVESLVVGLAGSRMIASETHGKQMLFRTDRGGWLGVHLGMTGALGFSHEADFDDRYAHLFFQVENGFMFFEDPRQFGRVRFSQGNEAPAWWANLPVQVLDDAFTWDYLRPLILRRKGTQLKPLLLMQDLFPGVGNWMADEILWKSRLAPHRRVNDLSETELQLLFNQIRRVSREALQIVGDDWGDFPDDWLFNHRWKDGGICPMTKRPLKRETIGGRTTCWSPAWQR